MTTRSNLKAVLAAFAGLAAPVSAGTVPRYSVTLLPASNGGMGAWGVNGLGHAAGEAGPAAQAFAWLDGARARSLGYLSRPYQYSYQSHAYAINDSDVVVGMQRFVSDGNIDRGFYWTQTNGMIEIVPPTGYTHSSAQDINNAGTVIGTIASATSPSITQAYRWTKGGGITLLGTLGGTNSAAIAINSLGHIVGTSDVADGSTHLYLMSHDGPLTPADDIYPVSGTLKDVNDADQVLVWDRSKTATVWQNGQSTVLPQLLADATRLEPFAINIHGDVVGTTAGSSYVYSAFHYHNGSIVDLNTLIPPKSGWALTIARNISDAGHIVGWGYITPGGYAAFLLTPIVYGDANGDGKVDTADVVTMLGLGAGLGSGPLPPGADVAPSPSTDSRGFGDGRVDLLDALRTIRYISGLETAWP